MLICSYLPICTKVAKLSRSVSLAMKTTRNKPNTAIIRPALHERRQKRNIRQVAKIGRGRFKGQYDTRSIRCFRAECRSQTHLAKNCTYCRYLPYFLLKLRFTVLYDETIRPKPPSKPHLTASRISSIQRQLDLQFSSLLAELTELLGSDKAIGTGN